MKCRTLLLVVIFAVAGCVSPLDKGFSLISPGTWFSHAEANKVDKATVKVDETGDKLRKIAQTNVHAAQIVLNNVSGSARTQEVAIADDYVTTAAQVLDQTEGPMQTGEFDIVKKQVFGRISLKAPERDIAEKSRNSDKQEISKISADFDQYKTGLDKANLKLREGFDRENALANELRTAQAWHWVLGGTAFLMACGWLYARYFLGGIPNVVGGAIARLEAKNPASANDLRSILDQLANRHEQQQISNAYAKAR